MNINLPRNKITAIKSFILQSTEAKLVKKLRAILKEHDTAVYTCKIIYSSDYLVSPIKPFIDRL